MKSNAYQHQHHQPAYLKPKGTAQLSGVCGVIAFVGIAFLALADWRVALGYGLCQAAAWLHKKGAT